MHKRSISFLFSSETDVALFSSRKLSVFFEINQRNRFDRFADVQNLYSGNTCWWVLRKIRFPTEIVLPDIKPLHSPCQPEECAFTEKAITVNIKVRCLPQIPFQIDGSTKFTFTLLDFSRITTATEGHARPFFLLSVYNCLFLLWI